MDLKEQKRIAKERLKEIETKLNEKKNIKSEGETKLYLFNQNNSGGSFENNDNICEYVFIEAHSAKEANLLADNFGIYFDGCDQGVDCSCCGDRWYETSESDGNKNPLIYGKDVYKEYKQSMRDRCIIHYLNGKRELVMFKNKDDGHEHIWEQCYDIGRKCKLCEMWESELKK